MHSYVHQPYLNVRPGWTLAQHGSHLSRANTWWPYGNGWVDLASNRSRFLLQQGTPVADLLVLSGESAPNNYPHRPAIADCRIQLRFLLCRRSPGAGAGQERPDNGTLGRDLCRLIAGSRPLPDTAYSRQNRPTAPKRSDRSRTACRWDLLLCRTTIRNMRRWSGKSGETPIQA